MARPRARSNVTPTFKCPECGRTFTRAAALGAHRRRAHGVIGASAQARSRASSTGQTRRTNNRTKTGSSTSSRRPRTTRSRSAATDGRATATRGTVDRNQLLKTLFPNGIPANEEAIRAVNTWLDDAERLAQMK